MPIYEYRCPDCGHEFEQLQSFKDPAITACPGCGENDVRKLISKTNFALKGGGWYKDHYGLKPAATGKSDGGSKSDGASKSSSGGGESSAPAPSPAPAPSSAE